MLQLYFRPPSSVERTHFTGHQQPETSIKKVKEALKYDYTYYSATIY
jgi:hypothetical protein